MSERKRELEGHTASVEKLRPLAAAIIDGTFPEQPTEADTAAVTQMISLGKLALPTFTMGEQWGIKHPIKDDVTYLASFLYKHSPTYLSIKAASTAALTCLYPSTKPKGKKANKA